MLTIVNETVVFQKQNKTLITLRTLYEIWSLMFKTNLSGDIIQVYYGQYKMETLKIHFRFLTSHFQFKIRFFMVIKHSYNFRDIKLLPPTPTPSPFSPKFTLTRYNWSQRY